MNGMSKVYVRLNKDGVRALLKGDAMQSILTEHCNNSMARLGDGYEFNVRVGEKRCYANLFAVTYAAAVENEESNTLLAAIRG